MHTAHREGKVAIAEWHTKQLNKHVARCNMRQAWRFARLCTFTKKGSKSRWDNAPITSQLNLNDMNKKVTAGTAKGGLAAEERLHWSEDDCNFGGSIGDIQQVFNEVILETTEDCYPPHPDVQEDCIAPAAKDILKQMCKVAKKDEQLQDGATMVHPC